MNIRYLPAVLLFLVLATQAAPVYKHVDEQGQVTYSDKPVDEGDQPVTLKPVSVIPGRPVARKPEPAAPATETTPVRYELEWLKPLNEQTLRNIGGKLEVDLKLKPGLPAGHRVELWLDGVKKGEWEGVPVTLTEVWRGTHSLEARLVDAQGKALARSAITIYVHQNSLLISTPIDQSGG